MGSLCFDVVLSWKVLEREAAPAPAFYQAEMWQSGHYALFKQQAVDWTEKRLCRSVPAEMRLQCPANRIFLASQSPWQQFIDLASRT